jgi:hypothetical protein
MAFFPQIADRQVTGIVAVSTIFPVPIARARGGSAIDPPRPNTRHANRVLDR